MYVLEMNVEIWKVRSGKLNKQMVQSKTSGNNTAKNSKFPPIISIKRKLIEYTSHPDSFEAGQLGGG